jgi:hypothetical protein
VKAKGKEQLRQSHPSFEIKICDFKDAVSSFVT